MTEEDETARPGLGLAPVVAVQLLASPVGDLAGGEQGGQGGPDKTGSVLLSSLITSTCNHLNRLIL